MDTEMLFKFMNVCTYVYIQSMIYIFAIESEGQGTFLKYQPSAYENNDLQPWGFLCPFVAINLDCFANVVAIVIVGDTSWMTFLFEKWVNLLAMCIPHLSVVESMCRTT